MARKVHLAYGPSPLGGASRLARLEGRLAVDDDGCVFAAPLGGAAGATGLLWPLDYTARLGSLEIAEILDGSGNVVLREGQAFFAAGGLAPDDFDTPEKRHAREVHGRDVFLIGRPVEALSK